MSKSRLDERIALITGASRGIGRAVALAFAREGAHVILTARTVGGLEEVDDQIRGFVGTASLLPLDLKDGEKVDRLGPTLFERWGRLDVLVANAGLLGNLSPLGHVRERDWNMVLEVNLTANWRLIRTLDPILQKSGAGRAIFVTSGAARRCRAYWGPYSVSKAALEALVKTYAGEIANTTVRANLIDPGAVATGMRAKAMPGEDPATLPRPEAIAEHFIPLAMSSCTKNGELINIPATR